MDFDKVTLEKDNIINLLTPSQKGGVFLLSLFKVFIVMDQDQVEIALNKLLPNVLPEHVTDIAFDVRHTAPNQFTLYALFAVSDDYWDRLDYINRAAFLHDTKVKLKHKAKSYTDINIVFDKDNTRMIKQSDFQR